MSKVVKMRICRECGTEFNGGPRAWYCPECRKIRIASQHKEFKARKKSGKVQPLGTLIKCVDCGKEFIKNGGLHQRCPDCAAIHLHEVDAIQSKMWKKNNFDVYKQAKDEYLRKKNEQGENKKSGISGITWDKGKCLWKICPYDSHNKKQIYIGYAHDLQQAKEKLESWVSGNDKSRE